MTINCGGRPFLRHAGRTVRAAIADGGRRIDLKANRETGWPCRSFTGQRTTPADVQALLDIYRATGDHAPSNRSCIAMGEWSSRPARVTRDAHDAEVAAQAVFLTLALEVRGDGGGPIRNLGPWLQQVAPRVSLDLIKLRRRRQKREDQCRMLAEQNHLQASSTPSVHRDSEQDELRQILHARVERAAGAISHADDSLLLRRPLSRRHRGQLKCKPKALGMRLFRDRKMLRTTGRSPVGIERCDDRDGA